ncbi:hypothetical protein ACH4SP_40515 [Streptomyces sp. NPDC021093]|uniref:hypothetical protein n=1 Tax=Streptomyces sp. NPDC021093 TaxID=3365112 RepID=UPI003788847C
MDPERPDAPKFGSSTPDLASSPSQKKAAANAIERHLQPDTSKDGKAAADATNAAVREFSGKDGHGWDTSAALKKAHETWGKQVKTLIDRLATEKYALRDTSGLLRNQDVGIGTQIRPRSPFDKF